MRVEVEFFDAEGGRHFALIIHVLLTEHLLLRVVLQDVASRWVLQVAAYIRRLPSLVDVVTLTILEDNDVATLIAIELAQDVVYVKGAMVGIRGHLHWVCWLVEVLDKVLRHDDFSLEGLLFFAQFLLTRQPIRHLSANIFAVRNLSSFFLGDASLSLKLFSLSEELGSLELVLLSLHLSLSLFLFAKQLISLFLETLALKTLFLDALLSLAQLLQPLGLELAILLGSRQLKLPSLLVELLLFLQDALLFFTSTVLFLLLFADAILFLSALSGFLLFFDSAQTSFLFEFEDLKTRRFLQLESLESLLLLLF
mmetsp:Transcript_13465/g.18429  ORF Transcript_13465/g.18429 Transcript_13465/m.18429 type:complete len:311 (-) Transcript_13465:4071-5003(-)